MVFQSNILTLEFTRLQELSMRFFPSKVTTVHLPEFVRYYVDPVVMSLDVRAAGLMVETSARRFGWLEDTRDYEEEITSVIA